MTSVTSNIILRASVQDEPIDVGELEALVENHAAGAFVTFVGKVRHRDGGREVELLDYSAHPTANAEVHRIADEVLTSADGVHAIALSHRIGRLAIGDVAVVCVVAAEHRAQAFDTCRELIERIKHELPIWKHQVFSDGTDEWVGSP